MHSFGALFCYLRCPTGRPRPLAESTFLLHKMADRVSLRGETKTTYLKGISDCVDHLNSYSYYLNSLKTYYQTTWLFLSRRVQTLFIDQLADPRQRILLTVSRRLCTKMCVQSFPLFCPRSPRYRK